MRGLFAILTLATLFVGCDKQSEYDGPHFSMDEPIKTSINVSVEQTRAVAGVDSAEGVFRNGILGSDNDNVTMRYIMQIFIDGVAATKYIAYSDEPSVKFTPELVPNCNYRFVVWADVVTHGKTNIDNHYNTADLTDITLRGSWSAMDESRDAFTGFAVKNNFVGESVNIVLSRPFAKLRIVANDKDKTNAVPVRGEFTYTTPHRVSFNAVTGVAAAADLASAGKTHSYTIDTYTNDTDESFTLFTDYIFAVDDALDIKFAFYEEGVAYPIMNRVYAVDDVRVMRNRVTTIKGELLTGDEVVIGEDNISITEWGNGGEVLIPGIVPGI